MKPIIYAPDRHLKRFKCFGTGPDSGNEAVVIFGGGSSEWSVEDRQRFATLQNANACVFINVENDGLGPCILDFYYPHARSPLCLHASLAAAHYLQTSRVAEHSRLMLTSMNKQALHYTQSANEMYVSVTPQPVKMPAPSWDAIANLLGCPTSAIKVPPAVASIGSPKLLVEMVSFDALHALHPDLHGIVEWGKTSAISGCYAYVHREGQVYEGRNFNHLDERLEDAATGVAAGALRVLLARDIILYQGQALGNPCRISASVLDGRVCVGGQVIEMQPSA
ncbi:PhzF family phenazine biosynthesis protein [Pseudomonas batumici]|uniref:PhzF family phenazine biosynthesis protein n=1 Tax=Pseudomonas batumici TaxID=226910 RepID=UPI000694C253|nr:PhzF family phenazine biosynthesis protein [Pseudomonas batumici]